MAVAPRFCLAVVLALAASASFAQPQSQDAAAADRQQAQDLDALLADDTAAAKPEPATPPAAVEAAPPAAAAPGTAAQAPSQTPPLAEIPVKELPTPAPTPRPKRSGTLEEIVVTAQKLEQSAKDVPISISVLDAKQIAEKGIVDLREAMLFVPNVKVESAGFFSAPRARGFSFNNNNKAIEPPLGIAIDGIPYTTPTYFTSAVFDVSRIEVLRGPQGTTFGKNTTAGLIHIITSDPSPEWTGKLDLQAGELGRKRLELAVGGPLLADVMEFRLALLKDERDGFVRNTTHETNPALPATFRGYQHQGLRAKLKFPDLLSTSLKLSYEYVTLQQDGAGEESARSTQPFRDVVLKYDPNADFIEGNYIASIDGKDFREATVRTLNLEWKADFGGLGITALAGRSVLDTTLAVDADFTPVPALHGTGGDKNPTTTFELRGESLGLDGLLGLQNLFGRNLGSTDIVAGVFYQKREILDSTFDFTFFNGPFLELTSAASGVMSAPVLPLPADGSRDEFTQGFEQTGDVKAVFGQAQWRFLPKWGLQTGMRLSHEQKRAVWNQVFTSPPPNAVVQAAGLREFTARRSLAETQVQPKISLQYDPIEEVSLFVHWARAFKGGGYNAFAFSDEESDEVPPQLEGSALSVPQQLQYGPETLEEWGADLKTSAILDGTLRFNFSLFRMNATDFQVLSRVRRPNSIGLGVTKVENAPKARSQGLEGDVMWKPLAALTLVATIGFNDTEYLDFKTNECPADRTNEDGDEIDRCDATGKSFPFAPKWDSTLSGSWQQPLPFWGLNFNLGGTVEYQSSQLLDLDLDERKRQQGFARYKANIGIGNLQQGWSFQVIGNNLGNQASAVRKGDVFGGQFISIPEPPREIFGQFRYAF